MSLKNALIMKKLLPAAWFFFQTNQNVKEKTNPPNFFVFTLLTVIPPNYKGGFESDGLSCGILFPLKNIPFIGESARMPLWASLQFISVRLLISTECGNYTQISWAAKAQKMAYLPRP